MTYLSQVVSETLRLHPPVPMFSRQVTKDYQIPDSDVVVPKGVEVMIPVYSLHCDPAYFEEPEKFDPDRFSESNKDNIKKCSYLPFGSGPRICIGQKFALVEVKAALSKILLKYKIVKCDKTRNPLVLDKRTVFMVPEGGIWVALEKRR